MELADSNTWRSDSYICKIFPEKGFTIQKIGTKFNPADLNTKRLGCERRKFLAKLMNLLCGNADEENDDNSLRQTRRVNMVTRAQCVGFIQMAGTALGMCLQLKGCADDEAVRSPNHERDLQ